MLTGRLYVPGDDFDLEYKRDRKEWEESYWGQLENCVGTRPTNLDDFVSKFDPARANETVKFRDYSFSQPVTVLMLASRLGRTEICQYLLKLRDDVVDPNIQDGDGLTALQYFMEHSMIDINTYTLRVELLQAFLDNPKVDLNLGPAPSVATEENGWNHEFGYKPAMIAFCPWRRSLNRNGVYGQEILFRMIVSGKPIDLSAKTLEWIDDGKRTGPMRILTTSEYLGNIAGLPAMYVVDPVRVTRICIEFAKKLSPETLRSSERSSNGIVQVLMSK